MGLERDFWSPSIGLGILACSLWLGLPTVMVGQLSSQCSGRLSITVSDDHFFQPVRGCLVEFYSVEGHHIEVLTNDSGKVTIQLPVPLGSSGARYVLKCSANEMMSVKDALDLTQMNCLNDTLIARNYSMEWAGPCIDSFAPGFLHFEQDRSVLSDSLETLLVNWALDVEEILGPSSKFRIELMSSCGYDESLSISKEREDYIKGLLINNGVSDSLIQIASLGHEPFYYCIHCEGCLPKWQYGEGYLLSRDNVGSGIDIGRMNAMRRIVRISFVHVEAPIVDRTKRPTLD